MTPPVGGVPFQLESIPYLNNPDFSLISQSLEKERKSDYSFK